MSRVYLIRHGQSGNNAQPEHARVCDPDLTETGRQQAELTAQYLREVAIDHLYCSPFLRALETARPIAAVQQIMARIHADVFEQGGCYSGHRSGEERGEPGLGRSQLLAAYPGWEVDAAIEELGWWGREYENLSQATLRARRVAKWLTELVTTTPGNYAVVIHADFKRLLLFELLPGQSHQELATAPLYNTGVTSFAWESGWQLQKFNSVDHLPPELVT